MNQFCATALLSRWELKPLKHLFDVLNGATPSSSEPNYWDGNIFWATPEDVGSLNGKILDNTRRKITEDGYINCGTKLAPVGSLVLTTRAPVGNLAISAIPLCTNQGCKTLVPKLDTVHSTYYYYQLVARKQELQILATGTTFYELGSDELRSFKVLSPSFEEQRAIADMLDRETARLDELIAEKERLLKLLAEKRRALITSAVTCGLNNDALLRDSGLQWLGEIPAHWETERTRWLFMERDKRTETGKEELLTVSHLTGVTPRSEKEVNMFEAETTEGYKICRRGDLAINTMWAFMGAMGTSPTDGIVSPSYNVYIPNQGLLSSYIDALVRIPYFCEEVRRFSKGVWSSRLRLYPEEFFSIWLPVPPIDDQRAIVDYIERETKKLHDLRDVTAHTIGLLKERRAALIAAAVTGQIPIETLQ